MYNPIKAILSHFGKKNWVKKGGVPILFKKFTNLSTPYRFTIWNSARLIHHVLFNMGDLHLVLPALNMITLNAGILIMMQQVRLMMFALNMVEYSMSFLWLSTWDFFCWTSKGDHSEPFLLFEFFCGTPPLCIIVMGWWVAHKILV